MRHYETDSTPAAARLLALTVLADGGLDRNELDAMMQADLARRLSIGRVEFERILREYCDDLLLSANYLDGVRLKVNSAEDIPAEFHLFDPRARLLRPGRVIWRAGREIGVHFQGPAFEPDRSADVRMARFAYL